MITMKNVNYLTKLRRLVKLLAVSIVYLVLGVVGSSFTNALPNNNDGIKKSGKDSTQNEKNAFPGLFSTNSVDPTKPYLSQLNPKVLLFVQNFVEENTDRLNRMKVWGKPYFDMYDGILSQYGLPTELKYLSVIESSLKTGALSSAGALGPWQIMPGEARRLGLKVNSRVDERKNFYKSTQAAASFMKELHAQFHDWILVIAAYNCGPGRLRQAIRKSGSKDFWTLQKYLPLETRNHVKKFIGTHYIMEGSGGLTTMTAAEIERYHLNVSTIGSKTTFSAEELNRTMSVEISGKYNSGILAKVIGMELSSFNHLNPNFDKLVSKGGPYSLRLPIEKMMKFDAKKQQILEESVHLLLK